MRQYGRSVNVQKSLQSARLDRLYARLVLVCSFFDGPPIQRRHNPGFAALGSFWPLSFST